MGTQPSQSASAKIVRLFEAKVRRGGARCRLWERKGPFVVGYSGGGDSTALLLSLAALLERAGLRAKERLLALHVHHGLRPGAADGDAAHAEAFCREREIPFRLARVRVKRSGGRGLEAAARDARRAALLSAADELGSNSVLLAHTRDDQVETVLMRLFEGGGPRGMAGIRPVAPLLQTSSAAGEGVLLFRPMLDLTRAEILDYLEAREAAWVEDETNADESRLRNRIRRRVWPVIEESLGGDVGALIASGAERLGALLEVLDAEVRDAEAKFVSETGAGEIRIRPLGAAAGLAQAVRAGLWRAALDRSQAGGKRGRRSLGRLISGIDDLVTAGGPSGQIDLPGGLVARRVYDVLVIGPSPEPRAVSIEAVPLALPGRTRHGALGVELLAAPGEDGARPVVDKGCREVSLDADRLGKEAFLRSRLEGDRFRPAGAPGERKLKAFFIDRKIPRAERDFIPLVAVGKEIAWVVGHAVSEQYRAGADTRRVITLRADRTKREPEEN